MYAGRRGPLWVVIGHLSRPFGLISRSSEARQIEDDTCGNMAVMGLAVVKVLVKYLIWSEGGEVGRKLYRAVNRVCVQRCKDRNRKDKVILV